MSDIIEVLTVDEDELKAELENVIFEELKTIDSAIVSLSRALREYRDKELYRDEFGTFAECAAQKFKIGRSRAQQLIACGQTVEALVGLPLPEGYTAEPTEGQVRAISKASIPDEVKREVYAAAVEEAADKEKPLTGAMVAKKLEEVTRSKLPEPKETPPTPIVPKRKPGYILLLGKALEYANGATLAMEEALKCSPDSIFDYLDGTCRGFNASVDKITNILASYNEDVDE